MKELSGALEGAFAVVLGQSTLLLSKALYTLMVSGFTARVTIIAMVSLINTLAIASNWVSCRIDAKNSTGYTFLLDVVTLAAFFVLNYTIDEHYIDISILSLTYFSSVSYICIHLLFILWNKAIQSQRIRGFLYYEIANSTNLIGMIACGILFYTAIMSDDTLIFVMFCLYFLYWVILLIYYIYNLLNSEVPVYLCKATWFRFCKDTFEQFYVSMKSHAHAAPKPIDSCSKDVRVFYEKKYRGRISDSHTYDGNCDGYYDIIKPIISLLPKDTNIIDLGCGKGSLLKWLIEEEMAFNSYTGVDFAIRTTDANRNIRFVRSSVESFSIDYNRDNTIVLTNVICYLSQEQLNRLMSLFDYAESVIVIEPHRGLFWDAYFDNIHLYYRKPKDIIRQFASHGYVIRELTESYGIMNSVFHCLRLVDCFYFVSSRTIERDDDA